METKTKQRWVGLLFLAAILSIFLPLLFHHSRPLTQAHLSLKIPKKPPEPQADLSKVNQADHALPMETSKKVDFTSAPEAWVIQLGAFSDKANAESLIKKIRAKGFDVYSRSSKNAQGKEIERVFVGPEIHYDKIIALQKTLKSSFQVNGVIRKYQAS